MTDQATPLSRINRTAFLERLSPLFLLFPVLFLKSLALTISPVSAAEVAILKSADVAYYNQAVQAFRETQSSKTTITEYNLAGNLARGREIAMSLRAAPPGLVLAVGLKAALAAKLELVDTPVVFCLVLNPESQGLLAPNMTGILMRVPPAAQLTSIQTLAPRARRIGLLYDPGQTGALVTESERIARKLGLELIAMPVESSSDVPGALRRVLPTVDLFWLLQDQTVITEDSMEFIIQATLEAKVPMFGFSPTLVQQGALGALVVNAKDMGRQAGDLATAIIKGGSPSSHPPQNPTRPQLALNLNSAEYFGLIPSKETLRLATLLYGGPGAVAQQETMKDLIP
ncbi:MAG: ABC transporter substrate-binding protein [Nitrospira sp.]|nr:ABC transporter substrate-binding protein [Nitrospira sp.]